MTTLIIIFFTTITVTAFVYRNPFRYRVLRTTPLTLHQKDVLHVVIKDLKTNERHGGYGSNQFLAVCDAVKEARTWNRSEKLKKNI